MSLNVFNEEYMSEVKEFAEKIGMSDQLQQQLDYLGSYNENTECNIGPDFAPHSFAFTMHKDGKEWFNGGLIFHGDHDNGGDGGAPTFSVNLTPVSGWAVHT